MLTDIKQFGKRARERDGGEREKATGKDLSNSLICVHVLIFMCNMATHSRYMSNLH